VTAGGCLTDVPGIRLGHFQRQGRGWRTGTTVALLPPGTVGGIDVRGGGPGTRDTDLLHPTATMDAVHAICLTGGSAYGLAAAGGVMRHLEAKGIGFQVGPAVSDVVPIVPSAVIFDLGRGGSFQQRPDESFGERAARAARSTPSMLGAVGAGTGALSRGLQGGVGTASVTLPNGVTVSAIAVVNSAGSVIDPDSGLPWMPGRVTLRRPPVGQRDALRRHLDAAVPPLNTTIGIVATTAALTKAECSKFASVAHDGLARAIRPVHSLLDGDTVFGVSTGSDDLGSLANAADPGLPPQRARVGWLNAVLEAGAACFAAACTDAIVHARATGADPSYRDLCPDAYPRAFPSAT
jgi:L-aminopeptidase/D-esterase-like protein